MTADYTPFDQQPEFRALDAAIRTWFTSSRGDEIMPTGWVLIASGMRIANLPAEAADSYTTDYVSASGQSVHHTIGLVEHGRHLILNPRGWDSDDDE